MHEIEPTYRFRAPFGKPEDKGAKPPNHRRAAESGMLIERDLAVRLRDGVEIYVDIYRPVDQTKAVHFLRKPFQADAFCALIETLLRSHPKPD